MNHVTNLMQTNFIREKILEIVSRNRGKSNFELNDSTSLMNDLGIDGDDALEVLNQYFTTFKSLSNLFCTIFCIKPNRDGYREELIFMSM